jgi:hypothetical protein
VRRDSLKCRHGGCSAAENREEYTCSQLHERVRQRLLVGGQAKGATVWRCYRSRLPLIIIRSLQPGTSMALSYTPGSDFLCRYMRVQALVFEEGMPSPSLLVVIAAITLPQVDATSHFLMALIHLMRARGHDFKMDGRRPLKSGPGAHPNPSPGHQYTKMSSIERPLTPVIPQTMHRSPIAPRPCNVTLEILNPVVIEDRDAAACAWLLPLHAPLHEDRVIDVLAAFPTATRGIRHVRNYVIALSDWDSHCHHAAPKEEYRSKVDARNAGRRVLPVVP